MGDFQEFKNTEKRNLVVLYKLVFDMEAINQPVFKFIEDIVGRYLGVDSDYRQEAQEDGEIAELSLEDVLVHLENVKSQRQLNKEEEQEYIYCRSVNELTKQIDKEKKDRNVFAEVEKDLSVPYSYLTRKMNDDGTVLENCYKIARAYLKNENSVRYFQNKLKRLEKNWTGENSLNENSALKELFDNIRKYAKQLGVLSEINDKITEIWERKFKDELVGAQ